MDLGLAGRTVLVAGSSRGIGLATARAFLAEGSRTAITGRTERTLEEARTTLESEFGAESVLATAGDLRDHSSITTVLDDITRRWGPLHCLVANVGSGSGPPGWNLMDEDWFESFQENLAASHRLAEHVLPAMTGAGGGSIVFVASIAGIEMSSAPLPYSAAKAALISYSKNLARQVGRFDVRVNCVAPGNVLFPGGSWERHLASRHDEVMLQIESDVPLRRFGSPEEIANVIVFLSSDRASFMTGTCVVADGGETRGM